MPPTFSQFSEQVLGRAPLLIIGSGVSCGAGVAGMQQLAEWLTANVTAVDADRGVWQEILQRINDGLGLEPAILEAGASLSPALRNHIVVQTWRCIRQGEYPWLSKIAKGEDPTGFSALLKRFSHTNNTVLDVVTTNYDHLLEWSAAMAGWAVWDGFERGALANPITVDRWEAQMRLVSKKGRTEMTPHIRIHKLHGSLSWFRHPHGAIKMHGIHESQLEQLEHDGFTPAIVTPANEKYLDLYREPYGTVLSAMRTQIGAARALIFVGFGFNDLHIEAGFEAKLVDPSVSKLILAKKQSVGLHKLVADQKIRSYVIVEDNDAGDSAMSSDILAPGLVGAGMWSFKGMLMSAWGIAGAP